MSEITSIRPADLRAIERYLERIADVSAAVHGQVQDVSGRVARVQSQQEVLAHELDGLARDFAAFVAADAQQKELQLAETRIVKVRQELETTFGYYAEVRRRATGILQALDAGVVTHDSIQQTTEDLMMSAPGYWLAPALVGVAAWIRGDRSTAERAVAEALRRDDYKTSLYFSLVLHRYQRTRAAAVWLHRFFAHQDPAWLDREFVVLLDVIANGFFGPDARNVSSEYIAQWLAELSQQPGFVVEQVERWATALVALRPAVRGDHYPTLMRHSPTWDTLRESLSYAQIHRHISSYFREMFSGEIVPLPRLASELDLLLRSLVTNFDDEELPLRRKERELQLIIDSDGNRQLAMQRFAAEARALDERVSFTGLLTNAAMHPEISKASLATQRYSVALSRDWIVQAHETLTGKARVMVPAAIVIRIEAWTGSTQDGSNERELAASLETHLRQAEETAVEQVRLSTAATLAPFAAGVLIVYGLVAMVSFLALIAGAGALAYWFFERKSLVGRKDEVVQRFRRTRDEHSRILKLALSEAARYREDLLGYASDYEDTRDMLSAISPDESTFAHTSEAPTLSV
jgi:hypothetical protein